MFSAFGDMPAKRHTEIYDGIPAQAWIAMGLEKNTNGYGAYSSYNIHVFEDNGYDAELAERAANERIAFMLRYYRQHLREGMEFFKEKILWQWVDPTFNCFHYTNHFSGKGLIYEIYYGKYRKGIYDFMNFYQNLIYAGVFMGCIYLIKKKNAELWESLG